MIGSTISHYKILEELGRGGMGVVYKARDTSLDRDVAIKFLPPDRSQSAGDRSRFMTEAKTAAALSHPNVATIHSIEAVDDTSFIVMEYIEGVELKRKVAGNPLPIDETIRCAQQIAEGIQAAHSKGIVHRDIKSSNILLTQTGRVKVMDFGLAKMRGGVEVTRPGTVVGTAAYMSPEQARGEPVDQRTDIWSFGVVLYEMTTGQLPFRGDYEHALLYSLVNQDPPSPSTLRSGMPPGLEALIEKCLQKEPEKRYQTFEDVLVDLKKLAGGEELTPSGTGVGVKIQSDRSFARRVPIFLGGIGVVILMLVSLYVGQDVLRFLGLDSIPTAKHLAVLPLANIGGDQTRQTFCDGLMETITSQLTQLEQFHGSLWVVPASEVRRNEVKSPSEAQQLFGVNLVVGGSLQLIQNRYRLTLNLIDANTLRQLNSALVDIGLTDLAGLQDESVMRLLQMLHVELHPESREVLQAGGTKVPAAYEYYIQGRGYLLRYEDVDNVDAAITSFQQAVKEDSTYALAHAGLGEAFWRKFEASKDTRWVGQATRQCQRALELDSLLAPVNVTLGLVYTGTGKYVEALRVFNRALEKDPANAAAYRGMARVYEIQGLLDDAESTFRKAIELKPDFWAGYNDLGRFYYRNGRYDDAIAQFRVVTELTPDNYLGFNNLGGMYYAVERWEESREMFERSFSIKKSYVISSNLGTLYYIEGRFADAARMYEEALKFNDRDHRVWGNLASARFWDPEQRGGAEEAFRKAIALAEQQHAVNPRDPEIMSDLAGYHAMIGEREKARGYLERSIALGGDDSQVMFTAGTTFERLGERDKAIEWIGKALDAGFSRSVITNQPELRELYKDDRFQALLKKSDDNDDHL